MLLAIDMGNTNTVFALCEGEVIHHQWRIHTVATRTADEYAVWLFSLMRDVGIEPSAITGVVMGSVVPEANYPLEYFAKHYLHCTPLVMHAALGARCMKVAIDTPEELGADRLINAIAAWQSHQKPLVVVDFGTATTFDVVDVHGAYCGGIIAPGIQLSLDALHRTATKLYGVAISKPPQVVGKNTTHAMQSGIYYGYVGLIEGIIQRINAEQQTNMHVVATGGLAPLYASATNAIHTLDSELTIRGLSYVYAKAQS
jgi:type III pantothenate kinase